MSSQHLQALAEVAALQELAIVQLRRQIEESRALIRETRVLLAGLKSADLSADPTGVWNLGAPTAAIEQPAEAQTDSG